MAAWRGGEGRLVQGYVPAGHAYYGVDEANGHDQTEAEMCSCFVYC